jgi:hypothetical protein
MRDRFGLTNAKDRTHSAKLAALVACMLMAALWRSDTRTPPGNSVMHDVIDLRAHIITPHIQNTEDCCASGVYTQLD